MFGRKAQLLRQQTDRRLRLGCLVDRAEILFRGDIAAALDWLNTPNPVFQHKSPLDFADTESGAEEVERLIMRIAKWVREVRDV